jgi:hypothetical protein
MDPGSVIPDSIRDRGDGLVKEPGFARLHSVIPDLIRNPFLSEKAAGKQAVKTFSQKLIRTLGIAAGPRDFRV